MPDFLARFIGSLSMLGYRSDLYRLVPLAVLVALFLAAVFYARPSSKPGERPELSSRRLWMLVPMVCVAWLYWHTPWLWPLRMLVTFLHELGHGFAALLTGGSILSIEADRSGGGRCHIQGGNYALILSAGYLGSMLAGALILVLACRTRWDKYVSLALGLSLAGLAIAFIRPFGYGFWMNLGIGAALAAAGWLLPEDVNDFLLTYIGTTSCLYAFFDLHYLLKGEPFSDATLAKAYVLPLPPKVWAALWMALSLGVLYATIRVALKDEPLAAAKPRSG